MGVIGKVGDFYCGTSACAHVREFCAISTQKQALIDDIHQIKLETFFHLGYHPLYNHHLALLFDSYSLSNLQHS